MHAGILGRSSYDKRIYICQTTVLDLLVVNYWGTSVVAMELRLTWNRCNV